MIPHPANLCFLLHMHQPHYVDPQSGRSVLPWVRLHGARAYLDVARLLDEYSGMRLSVNFVPSLVAQLEAVVAGDARDTFLDVAERTSWTPDEKVFLVSRFFSIHWGRGVDTRPRYRELLDKRGRDVTPGELARRASYFSDGELRDLSVLFHLAWLGFAAREDDRDLAELEIKGRGYDADDLSLVLARGRAACGRVLPLYRKLAARGQVELTASPYYHPIVPLLCDSDVGRRAQPSLPLPERFSAPADARRQITRGRAAHEKAFGVPTRGMWPSEGSISPEAVAAFRECGVEWLATDEGNLWRSLGGSSGDAGRRGELYRPWTFDGVDLVFRDRELSDRIGFSYAFGDARGCVDDLLGRARHAAASATRHKGEAALVAVVLDGENPWEAYPGSGEPFLRALFSSLSESTDLRSATIGEHLATNRSRGRLERLHSGSWIDSDFHIWIGDPVKNRAWDLLGRARRHVDRASRARPPDDPRVEAAVEHLLAAEGSDWFWWFGEPFHTSEEDIFDRLFRAHLAAAYRALGDPPPANLDEPVAIAGARNQARGPRGYIHPTIDGRVTSYFEWLDAGHFVVPRGAAMAQVPVLSSVWFGFDRQSIFLRLDPDAGARGQLALATIEATLRSRTREVRLQSFPDGRALRLGVRARAATEAEESAENPFLDEGVEIGEVTRGEIVELAVPFARLHFAAGDRLELSCRVLERGIQLGRFPADGHLEMTVPDEHFEADHWAV